MGFIKEFKEFAVKGNMIDMAVGIIIGGAFGTIVKSLVEDVIMPPIGKLTGGIDFKDLSVNLGKAVTMQNGELAETGDDITLRYGAFINNVISFLIVAFAVFMLVKAINSLKRKQEEAPAAPAAPSEEIVLLTQIRDALRR